MGADLRSKFLNVQDPDSRPFFMRLRCMIAGWIYPEFKERDRRWYEHYFTHQHTIAVHQHYAAECKQLNRAVTKKSKQVKELQKKLAALTVCEKSTEGS